MIDEEDDDSEQQFMNMQTVVMEELDRSLSSNDSDDFIRQLEMTLEPSVTATATRSSTSTPAITARIRVRELPVEQEEQLIKRLIDGDLTFNDYNQQIGQIVDDNIIDVDDDDEDDDNSDDDKHFENAADTVGSSSRSFEQELLQSRRDAIRGNLQGHKIDVDGKVQRRRCVLPIALQGLMGEANLCYARGQTELAEKVCFEIIRQVPLAPEPFLTLAQIHESNPEKYLQFNLIAAHLNPGDLEQWVRIAQMSIEQGNIRQAINCLMKATKYHPSNIDARLRRIELLELLGEDKLAFRCFVCMLSHIPADNPDFLMSSVKKAANQLVKESNMPKAMEAMAIAYAKVPQHFATEDIHFYLELLIANGAYANVVNVLREHAGVKVTMAAETVADCKIPSDIILDFRSKLMVALIHMRAFHLLDDLFANIFTFINVEDAGDCYLDIAEALMKMEQFAGALKLLVPLVQSKNYSLAAVWLRHADCCRAIGAIDDAMASYQQVVRMAPHHFDARLILSALLKQQGRNAEAMQLLEQDMENDVIDPAVMYEHCLMLKDTGCLTEYVDVGFQLLARHCLRLRSREEMQLATTIVKFNMKLTLIRENREAKGEPIDDADAPEFGRSDNEPSAAVEWELLRDIVRVACDQQRFGVMQKIIFTASTARRFLPYSKDLDFLALLASMYNRDAKFSYLLCKEYVTRHMDVTRAWNLFGCVLNISEDILYNRFLLRLFKRCGTYVETLPQILRPNYFLMSGSYKYAINDYVIIYKERKTPLVALLIAVTYAHLAQQKFIQKKHSLIAQSLAFAREYQRQRMAMAEHEVHYNLGRLHHQFGINNIAVWHYEQVLSGDGGSDRPELLDLKRETAFNLHLIYKGSGNMDLARKYLYDYVVV